MLNNVNFLEIFYFSRKLIIMGKGDKRSKRGKIHIGSYGVKRSKKAAKKVAKA